jgi:hypothetical protein
MERLGCASIVLRVSRNVILYPWLWSDYIIEKESLVNKFISIPKDKGNLVRLCVCLKSNKKKKKEGGDFYCAYPTIPGSSMRQE